jgi:hypothetical protein
VRRILASLSLCGAVLAVAAPAAHADDRIYIERDGGCYSLWIEAKNIPLFCYNPPPI